MIIKAYIIRVIYLFMHKKKYNKSKGYILTTSMYNKRIQGSES